MGRLDITLPDDLMRRLDRFDEQYEDIVTEMLTEGIQPLAKAAYASYDQTVSPYATGATRASLGITRVLHATGSKFKSGSFEYDIKFGFGDGKDERGTPYALKGNVLEYGRSNQPPRPWLHPAVRKARAECLSIMEAVCRRRLERL